MITNMLLFLEMKTNVLLVLVVIRPNNFYLGFLAF